MNRRVESMCDMLSFPSPWNGNLLLGWAVRFRRGGPSLKAESIGSNHPSGVARSR